MAVSQFYSDTRLEISPSLPGSSRLQFKFDRVLNTISNYLAPVCDWISCLTTPPVAKKPLSRSKNVSRIIKPSSPHCPRTSLSNSSTLILLQPIHTVPPSGFRATKSSISLGTVVLPDNILGAGQLISTRPSCIVVLVIFEGFYISFTKETL
jgi:hypothetical protein